MLYNFEQSEKQKAYEVEKDYVEYRQIKSKENRNNRQDEKGFVVNSGQKTFGDKHQDNYGQKHSLIKPP